jgi:ubiquinone biosynthesis protein COQ4
MGWARARHIGLAGVSTLRSGDFGATLATVQDGLDIEPFEALVQQMRAHPDGRWLLEHRPRIHSRTLDLAYLQSLPVGTLGERFLQHLIRNDLLRDVEIPPSPFPMSEDAAYAKARWRETHDFRHVLTDLGVSIRDEIVLQAFQLGQFHNRFALLQMTVGPLLAPCHPVRLLRSYLHAWRAGRRAVSLVCVRWESLWATPVEQLRQRLSVPVLSGDPCRWASPPSRRPR